MDTRQEMIGVRVNGAERAALRTLAAREARTESGWLRARLLSEAVAAGLYLPDPGHQAQGQRRHEAVHAE